MACRTHSYQRWALLSLTAALQLVACGQKAADAKKPSTQAGTQGEGNQDDAGNEEGKEDDGSGGGKGGKTWWKPTPDKPIALHWQLSTEFKFPRDVIPGVTVYDLDGELTTAETVKKLDELGPDIIVICYFDAGVFETYRSDADTFPQEIIGEADIGWENSYWLDVRQAEVLRPIMENRIKTWCKDKGFDAIEPDETEVWSNESGFEITKEQNNAYNRMIAELAHKHGLSVGLKGNTTETGDLVAYFDWTLNEECWEYEECDFIHDSFIAAGAAAFNIEYATDPDCALANAWRMNSARRDLGLVGPKEGSYRFEPCVPYAQNSWE